MSLKFTKMHGLGNDFMVVDATKNKIELSPEKIQQIADRRTGVGFDQLLIIEPSTNEQHDFVYRIFNANGQEVGQCGNGARCVAQYIFSEKLSSKKVIVLATLSGKIEAKMADNGNISVNMGLPQFAPSQIPFVAEKEALYYEISLDNELIKFGAVSLGNPHAVFEVNDVFHAPVQQIGQFLQHHAAFPKQVNVGFMEVVAPDFIRLRVYERGVGETRSCGSGACAAVAVGRRWQHLGEQVTVELPGGSLMINWKSPDHDIFIIGPAQKVFKGELLI